MFLLARGAGAPATNQANANASSNANVPANINAAANVNEPSNSNTSANANLPANTNGSSVPPGWATYDSSTSEFAHLRRLDPSFTVSYPADWKLYEELGGVYLAEAGRSQLEPQISISRSPDVITGDVIKACKDRAAAATGLDNLVYDTSTVVQVDGIASAYLSYHVPDSVQTHPSGRDAILVCIPLPSSTDSLWGRPRSSDLVGTNFDTILSTYDLHPREP